MILGIVGVFISSSFADEPADARRERILTHYSITSANDYSVRDPRAWRLLGSTNDGRTWIVLDQRTNQIFVERFETKNFLVPERIACEIFRLEISEVRDPKNANSVQIAEIDLRGTIDGQPIDLRPRRTDRVTVQGEFAPGETRRMVFDGNLQTKWLDFNLNESGERGTWIQWEYDAPPDADPDPVQPLTRVAELNMRARTWARESFLLDIKATVLWRGEQENSLVLHDSSGAALISLPLGITNAAPGTLVALTGNAFLVRKNGTVELQLVPLVNNDGVHEASTKSASTFLRAGKHPITLEWFNRLGDQNLLLEYEGPGVPKQEVPARALVQAEDTTENGVRYFYYEGSWEWLPSFGRLIPKLAGVEDRFRIINGARDNCGLVFTGYIEVPETGEYQFHLSSDDGSRLFIGSRQLHMESIGTGSQPVAPRLPAGNLIGPRDHFQWVSAEGEVTYIGEGRNGWEIVLQSRSGSMTVLVGTGDQNIPHYLLGGRVRVQGICVPTFAPDEHLVAGELVTPSLDHIRISTLAPRQWRQVPLSRIVDTQSGRSGRPVRILGTLTETNGTLSMSDGTGEVWVHSSRWRTRTGAKRAEALGQIITSDTGPLLRLAEVRELGDSAQEENRLPLLRTIEQIHALQPDEARRGYPVKVRGVVTCAWPDSEDAVIQDGTRGIFVPNLTAGFDDWPEVGDFFEVEGRTDPGGFAPVILADRVAKLGKGAMPEPIRPTWSQLLNGSMDMQFVEVRGIVVSAAGENIELLVKGGKLRLQMENMAEAKLKEYENSIVRLRGCLSARWDDKRKVVPGELKMNTVAVSVERDAPEDLFSVPTKRAGDLLLFDPRADDLQRIKVLGQIVAIRGGVYFLVDGDTGIRVTPRTTEVLFPGDFVEVVGFPRTEGPALILREAIARRVDGSRTRARVSSVKPRILHLDDLLEPENDARKVTVRARVLGVRTSSAGETLELQVGQRTVIAHMLRDHLLDRVPAGSEVDVTGVYVGHGSGNQRKIDGFEILVGNADDVRVIARPPWWTMEHTTMAALGLVVILGAAGIWIRALRREVARKTKNLVREVEDRKKAEELAHVARREAEAAAIAAEAGSRAKSQFLATMSHEIRTPMNGILGMNTLLLETGLTREQRELAETVQGSGEALLHLLNDVLDFSKIEAGKLTLEHTMFRLHETIEAAVDLIAQRAQSKGLELNYQIGDDLPEEFLGDAGRFRQVLLNLLTNAVKFTEAGEIFLQVEGEAKESTMQLRVSIRDTGIGIPPHLQSRLFMAFEQADQSTTRRYGGTGLGLAICKRIVETMGGVIGVESSEGKGSTFWFTLPLQVAGKQNVEAAEETKALSGVRLVIVDLHERTRAMLRAVAEGWKMAVETFPDLAATSRWLRAQQHSGPTLVLMEFSKRNELSAVNFIESLHQFRSQHSAKDLRIGLLCPIGVRPSASDLDRAQIHVCLNKPPRKKQLRSTLLQLLLEPAHKPDREAAGATPARPKQSARILLAEDNIVNQRVALKQLARLGYDADVAHNGRQVIEAVVRGRYDIILMDCHMPEMDGYEATARIRALPGNLCNPRIIAMTANAMQGDRERCLEAGMDDYISKPVRMDDLNAALERSTRLQHAGSQGL